MTVRVNSQACTSHSLLASGLSPSIPLRTPSPVAGRAPGSDASTCAYTQVSACVRCNRTDGQERRDVHTSVRENVCNNSKKRKKSCFLKSEKNVKKRLKSRLTAYVQFHRPLNHSAFILNYRNRNSVPVPVSHQHHTPCSEMRTQETNMQLTCIPVSVIVKRL